MKRNVLIASVVFVMLVSACASPAAPTANPADVQGTAQAAALTIVALTKQAIPTNTPVPPTETPTARPTTAPPTDTPASLTTPGTQETLTTGGVVLPTNIPTFTLQPSGGSSSNENPCNQPLTSWQGQTVKFSIANQTKPKGKITLGLYVETEMGQCGNLVITGDSFSGPTGQYSASAFVDGKKDFKVFGSFRVNGGNWKIVVRNDKITAAGSCYPNC